MSKSQKEKKGGNLPAFAVFVRTDSETNKGRLEKVGAAWNNKNGTGLNVVLSEPANSTRLLVLPFRRNYE